MNFAEIENTWRSASNRPSAAQLEEQQMELGNELRRRRRATRGLLALTAIPLVLLTGRLVWRGVSPAAGLDPLHLTREWAVVPFFVLPWIGWLALLRWHRRHGREHANHEVSIRAGMAALLDENRGERRRSVLVATLLLLSLPLLGGVVWQLRAVGKAGDEILLPAFVIYPAYVAAMVGWIAWRYRRAILPRKRELEALLAEYGRVGRE